MARAAIYDALLNDPTLQSMGFDATSILVNYNAEQRPTDTMFINVHWDREVPGIGGDDVFDIMIKNLVVWVHMYKQFSTDFVRIDNVLDAIDACLYALINVPGADGMTVSQVNPGPGASRSRDMRDDAYQTICRSVSYRVIDNYTSAMV
jgi:hypothetical protein